MEAQNTKGAKIILSKNKNVGGNTTPELKLHYRAMELAQKQTHR